VVVLDRLRSMISLYHFDRTALVDLEAIAAEDTAEGTVEGTAEGIIGDTAEDIAVDTVAAAEEEAAHTVVRHMEQ
jgi:hypothetical protein